MRNKTHPPIHTSTDAASSTAPSYWVQADLSTEPAIACFEKTPLSQRQLPKSTYALLRDGARISPDSIALEYFPDAEKWSENVQRYTFMEVFGRITQTANLLHSLGIGSEDVISLMLVNVPESQFALWGAQATGIANPINWMLEPHVIASLLQSAGSRILIVYGGDTHIDLWEKVLQVIEQTPSIEIVIRLSGNLQGKAPEHVKFIDYTDVIDEFKVDQLDSGREIEANDIACYFPTGGTTSTPKLAIHTHGNEVISAWLSATVIALKAGDSRLSASPLFHVVGAISTSLATLGCGARLVMSTSSGWRGSGMIENFWHIVHAYHLNVAPMIPTILGQLSKNQGMMPDTNSLRVITSGSAPLSEHVASNFRKLTGKEVCEGYGMTETTSVIMMNPHTGIIKTGSVGLCFPYHAVRIIAPDISNGIRDVACGEPGLMLISGPAVISGYKDHTLDSGMLIENDWLNTGDLAKKDEEGYIWITGRVKDLIIRGGHNIDPKPLEEIFFSHPEVLEAVVVGRPDTHAGEVPVAYLALVPGSTATAETMLEYARKHVIERAAIPKDCYLMASLPKTAIGKIDKNTLRADAAGKAFSSVLLRAGLNHDCQVVARNLGASGLHCTINVSNQALNEKVKQALSLFSINYDICNDKEPNHV